MRSSTAHSPYAHGALACLRWPIPRLSLHGRHGRRTRHPLRAPTQPSARQELSDHVLAALEGRKACLLANHGQVALGPTPERALWLAGEIEALAQQYIHARSIGEPVMLDDAEMARVVHRFRDYGKQPAAPSEDGRNSS